MLWLSHNSALNEVRMRIAVTGASGFVGRHVLSELLMHDVEIIAVTRHAEGLAGLNESLRVVSMDISDPAPDCFALLGRPDVLIHLAWDGLPHYRSFHHVKRELPRQYNFLKAMIVAGLPSLLVTGTCLEYGLQSGELSEEMQTMPNTPYGYAKDALRQQLGALRMLKPFHFTWARLFYMYGAGQARTSLYSQLKESVLHGDRVFNMSSGEQVRDYLPVSEVARQIVALAMRKPGSMVTNVCSGKPISVLELVNQWLDENNWNIKLNLGYYPCPDYEPMAYWGCADRLLALHKELR